MHRESKGKKANEVRCWKRECDGSINLSPIITCKMLQVIKAI